MWRRSKSSVVVVTSTKRHFAERNRCFSTPTSIHPAARHTRPSHDLAASRPFDDFDVNAAGTLNLLKATRRFCPTSPFAHRSTNKVYGDKRNTIRLKELETRWEYDEPTYANGIKSTYTNGFPGVTNGVILAAGGSSWASLSDRNSKTNFHPIQPRVVLAKLADMPVSMWEYKGSPGRTYIGPTAQDFHQAFGLGQDDKSISTLDTDGVMYAAIQGLVEELKERDQMMALQRLENASALVQRDGEIESLKKDIRELKDRIDSMLPPVRGE